MPGCDVCGNDDDRAIIVTQGQRSMTSDSFECAIEDGATMCPLRPLHHRHVVEKYDETFCCVHCAGQSGASDMKDRAA